MAHFPHYLGRFLDNLKVGIYTFRNVLKVNIQSMLPGFFAVGLLTSLKVCAACTVIDTSCSVAKASQKQEFICEAFICGNIHSLSAGWEYDNGARVSIIAKGSEKEVSINGLSGVEISSPDENDMLCVSTVSDTVVYCAKGLLGYDN